jgi:hypothetical protein
MSTKERLLRLSLAHHRRDGCSERDCHFFGTIAHAKEAATLHASKGLVVYYQVRPPCSGALSSLDLCLCRCPCLCLYATPQEKEAYTGL